MKINMKMRYLTAKDLKNRSKAAAEEVWSVLKEIKKVLEGFPSRDELMTHGW